MPDPTTFSLDISSWRCGDSGTLGFCALGTGETYLLNRDGYMCCLGQFCLQRDVRPIDLLETPEPCYLDPGDIEFLREFINSSHFNSNLSGDLMRINDDVSTSIPQKIAAIRERMAKAGLKLAIGNIPPDLASVLTPDPEFQALPVIDSEVFDL